MNRSTIAMIVLCICLTAFAGCTPQGGGEQEPDPTSPETNQGESPEPKPIQTDEPETGQVDKPESPDLNPDSVEPDGGAKLLEEDYGDANGFLDSADLKGYVTAFTDRGCSVSELVTDKEADADFVSLGDAVTILYDDDVVFQTAQVKANGSDFSLSDGEQSDLETDSFVLFSGSWEETGFLADRVVIVYFTY